MPPLPFLVFVVGTGSLGAEIAAVRLLAPYFGASTIVWANTIGTSSWRCRSATGSAGASPTATRTCARSACVALLAAVLLALVPFVADPLLDVAVDALDEISAGAFVGSLLAVLVLVAVPVLLLGTVSPWAIRLAVHSVEEAGTVAGRLYALSTAGSLVGTLLSALLLIPLVGTRRTFLIFALAIAVVAVWGLRPLRRWALAPAAIAVLIALPVGTLKADTEGSGRVIHEAETEYQYARVIEYDDGVADARAERGPGGPLGVRGGVRRRARRPAQPRLRAHRRLLGRPPRPQLREPRPTRRGGWRSSATRPEPPRARTRSSSPTRAWTGWRSTRELSEIGRRYFDMNNPRLHLYHEDARPFLRRIDARYDVISVDAYRQPYIPFYVTTASSSRPSATGSPPAAC